MPTDEVLAWLSVWSEVQLICTWSSWCYCHPISSCFIKIQIGLTFLAPAYPGCPEKEAVKHVSVCLNVVPTVRKMNTRKIVCNILQVCY